MLRLLHKGYKGVVEMKQKLIKSGKVLIMLGFFIGMSQTVLAEETVAPAEKTVATTETTSSEDIQESTEPSTSISQPEVPESSISKDEVQTIENDVESLIKEQVGEKTGEEVALNKEYPASYIRQCLLETPEYGISKEDLAKYTDNQLEDTMTLFIRYNYDISGMDFGSYVGLLKTLYVDKTVSLEKALAQLSFNPSSFNSFAEMIPQVDKLQTYLNVLYPSNSSFIASKEMTNDELIARLTYLDVFEKKVKADGGTLGAGRIVYILNADTYGTPTDTTKTSTSDTKKADGTVASSDTTKKEDGKKDSLLKLPQTGEEKAKWAVSILGILLVVGAVIYLVRRNKANKSEE